MNAELERRVAERTAQLEVTNRELESFAYAVSHDLRAPLRSMSGFSQLLLESPPETLDDKSRHYLQRINEASRRMSALIEDLLGLSRISRTELAPRTVDFSHLIEEAAATVRERYPNHAVELSIEPGMTVHGDPRLLKIAMENLLDNAWKYTTRAQSAKVAVGSQTEPTGRTFYVRDNGVGFDMAYAGKLFGPFQRLHSDAQYPGTGIGLVTVQRILARHGGRIWAHAEPERGATFYFTLSGPER
jgi:light-regulated signal transduction histidine kinase (bacteriophytochrome)